MFKRLQEKWGVSTRQFWIIFLIFALTGTTTAILTRYVTAWLGMDAATWWGWKILFRLLMLLLGYQFILLGYAALLGQWPFFWKYEKKLLQKLGFIHRQAGLPAHIHAGASDKRQLAIFASGAGSNAARIMERLEHHPMIRVALVVCNKPGAGVIAIAASHGIPVLIIEKESFFTGDGYLPALKHYGIGFIVLAGFLWKVPPALINAYRGRIINIHPALLPKYGGKGMYGSKVHEAVIRAGEKESGITIHHVDEVYDNGAHIFQATCELTEQDTLETLTRKIQLLEHSHFPEVVEQWVMSAR